MSYKLGISCIMDENTVNDTICKMSDQIYANYPDSNELCVIGIRRRGAAISKTIADNLTRLSKGKSPLSGELDVTLYRDDLSSSEEIPVYFSTTIPFDINDKNVLLVDDVLYTGRTIKAALDAIFVLGRPAKVELAVLIDRGHRELPIKADYIGKTVKTKPCEYVRVKTRRFDGECGVYLLDKKRR